MVDCVFKLETKSSEDGVMAFINIDAPGNSFNRHAVRTIQKRAGAEDRKAAAEARRARRNAKRVLTTVQPYSDPDPRPHYDYVTPGTDKALDDLKSALWSTVCDSMADLDLPPTVT
jgi:hypothetical protein